MFKHCVYLVFHNARKPLEKVIYTGTVFEVFKEGFDRNSCAVEDPGTTYFVWGAFYGGAGRPVKHGVSLAPEQRMSSSSSLLMGKLEPTGESGVAPVPQSHSSY
jgi:hypothetical protein